MNFIKLLRNTAISSALFFILSLSILPANASAGLFDGAKNEACVAVDANTSGGKCDDGKLETGTDSLGKKVRDIIDILSIAVGIITVIMLIIAGLRYTISGGDSNNITSAKNTMIYAIIGLIIVAFAQVIVKFILNRVA